jgi:hypothetical protein
MQREREALVPKSARNGQPVAVEMPIKVSFNLY